MNEYKKLEDYQAGSAFLVIAGTLFSYEDIIKSIVLENPIDFD